MDAVPTRSEQVPEASPRRYLFGGLTVASDVPLPGVPRSRDAASAWTFVLAPAAPEPTRPDWSHAWRLPDGRPSLLSTRKGARYWLRFPGLALFSLSRREREIRCTALGADGGMACHLLLDQVLPRVLALEGRLVLHGGAIVTPRGACVFLGESGSGKSTLCAAFGRAGSAILGDDGLVVGTAPDGRHSVAATYPGLRLRPDSRRWLFGAAGAWTDAEGKHRLTEGPRLASTTAAAPLARLYVIDGADATGQPEVQALTPRESFVALVRHSFHLDTAGQGRTQALFERLGTTAASVPAARLLVPRSFWRLPDVLAAVSRDLAPSRAASRRRGAVPTTPSP